MTVPHIETFAAKLVFEQVGINEDVYEQSIIEVFKQDLGYQHPVLIRELSLNGHSNTLSRCPI